MVQGEITLGGHRLPREAETQHVLAVGTTGSGKSTLIEEVIAAARARGDRLVVCDPGGNFLSKFAKSGDQVLNPFDRRSPGWSLFSEVRRDYDPDRLARSVVPDGRGESAAWHHYAQILLASVIRALVRSGEPTTEALISACTTTPVTALVPILAGTPAAGLLEPEAAKALASTRFVLAAHLAPHAYLRPGSFSLRQWLADGGPGSSAFLTWRADMQRALAPLMSAWLDILATATLSLPPDRDRRLWLVIDELAALGPLASLEEALTLGRKHGLAVVAGLQSTAQLDELYGRHRAIVLRSCFRTLVALGIARTDPDTAEVLSRSLGEREVERSEDGRSLGDLGFSRSLSRRRVSERLVLPAEIAGLPDLRGYLALAGESSIRELSLTPRDRPEQIEGIVEDAP
jgi:type IV secretory pathway TraG/TraD family ATPase VirD4